MDKARRHQIKMLKFRKRLKNYRLNAGDGSFHCFRTTGKPCSCIVCKRPRYQRTNPNFKKSRIIETDFTHNKLTP